MQQKGLCVKIVVSNVYIIHFLKLELPVFQLNPLNNNINNNNNGDGQSTNQQTMTVVMIVIPKRPNINLASPHSLTRCCVVTDQIAKQDLQVCPPA